MSVNISGIDFESIVDGDGVRVVIFFSGCRHECPGCHNPDTHSFDCGREFTNELQNEIIDYLKQAPFTSGITLSGGDPMYSSVDIIPFVQKFRREVPHMNVWVYSGFDYEEIISDVNMYALLKECDVLVDGRFILSRRNTTLKFRGSDNQRIIDIRKSIQAGTVVEKRE